MRETVKTAWFLGLALLVGIGAFVSRPRPHERKASEETPVVLCPDLNDPLEVTRLEVVQYDEASKAPRKFEVAQVTGRDGKTGWAIPSHSDYPADAKDHLAQAASLLMSIKSINTAPGMDDAHGELNQENIRKLQNEFGVVDPASAKTSDTGIGTCITLKNKEDKVLASLIIGKAVGDQGSQHYVRYPDKDIVYIVDIDPSKVSTKFEDWIERNLLGMNAMDLKQVHIQDYAITPAADGLHAFQKHEGEYVLDYDFNSTPNWKLSKDLLYVAAKKAMVPRTLAADEEVDTKKLDDLKTAIDDLKIVDVERKPGAIPPDLRLRKESDLVGVQSLQERGFFVAPDPDGVEGQFRIVSNKGDVSLQLSDGACYVLRFGEGTGESSAADKAKGKKEAKKEGKKDDAGPGSNRYLFVMAEFHPEIIAKPVYEQLPTEEKKPEEKKSEGKKPDEKQPEAKKPEEKKPDAQKPDEKGAEKKKPDALMADDKAPEVKKADEKKADEKKPEEKKAEEKKPEAKDAKPAADAGKKEEVKKEEPKKEEPKKEEKKVDLKAERERIEKENKRKKEEYDEKIAAGQKHVKDLNDRFADWYYVISDDVYRKIHLTRADFIKKKEKDKPKDAAGHDHEHEHELDSLPPSPASKLEELKKDAPPPEKK